MLSDRQRACHTLGSFHLDKNHLVVQTVPSFSLRTVCYQFTANTVNSQQGDYPPPEHSNSRVNFMHSGDWINAKSSPAIGSFICHTAPAQRRLPGLGSWHSPRHRRWHRWSRPIAHGQRQWWLHRRGGESEKRDRE